jgi:hypothetical protein
MRVVEQRDLFDSRQHLPDDLNPIACNFWGIKETTGYVASWPIEALGGSSRDGIGFKIKGDDGIDWETGRSGPLTQTPERLPRVPQSHGSLPVRWTFVRCWKIVGR